MEKKEQKEELQSRREFFKKAAKTTLPILGAIALASNPLIAKAAEAAPMECNWTCSGGCSGTCSSSCGFGCSGSCKSGCGGCRGACTASCSGSCSGRCSGLCY
ncbi:MAG: Cys-Xaa-Xaa-Xaa repeat radical SAM target protein [Alloprevotella sp.]|nr:Cys-Xaa-Xaa-Xaa repeat radical SAM target protein [Alloprevotella sp.]